MTPSRHNFLRAAGTFGFVAAVIVAGCGYYSTSSRTAEGIKSVAVPFFENLTTEPSLEITVTENLIDNLVGDNTLKVTDEQRADAVLNGQIVEFHNRPFSFNDDLNAEEYLVTLRVKVSLFNRRLNQPVWADKTVTGDGSYFVDVPDASTFDDAVRQSVKEITDQILNLTVRDW